ncbi:hypothetical protein EVG20_g8937, partial [Dentipellis fragilis]
KRKKTDAGGSHEPATPAEPRRLRRSHEACARCRSKKIKASPGGRHRRQFPVCSLLTDFLHSAQCDSKHPRCTACAAAGTPCHQEDRHRQTLTPRGHTERLERQLVQCDALLKRHIPGFDLNNIDEILAREGIEIDPANSTLTHAFQFHPQTPGPPPPKGYPFPPPGQHMMPPGYPHPMPPYYGGPPGGPYPPPPHMQMPGPPGPYMHPFQHPPPPPPPPMAPLPAQQQSQQPQQPQQPQQQQQQQPRPQSAGGNDIKGQDPQSNDMSNTQALARVFGVSQSIVQDLKLAPQQLDKEDIAVGSNALISGRDRDINEASLPRDASKWIHIPVRRNSIIAPPTSPTTTSPTIASPTQPTVPVWLPKDRSMVRRILDIYFDRLNFHRPVFLRNEFEMTLDQLYAGQAPQHDPGFICSVYLVLALGTLSELNHRASGLDKESKATKVGGTAPHVNVKRLMPPEWPEHEEFFQRALAVKPELRVTVSSLQALILLQWYLYTERQGRTLWRLVGSLVRLAIELGLNHDPTTQDIFDASECQLRIRLWGIVLVHDRGTSILLGRPLAIAPYDSSTPHPSRPKTGRPDVSEHFLFSNPIADLQADIINSLYTPQKQSADQVMRHATRIVKSMVEFRRNLPDSYKWYFGGTNDWPMERRYKLVQDITEDEGLTLLKIGISRILLLRALFSSKDLPYILRHKALLDAIIVSHNIIVVHNQLIRFPDIAFFVSPIPLHIAAMVILYGHMSRCESLPRQVALEDVWMALDMLPSFRWRWERKDLNGGHPLIAKLAEKVLDVNLHQAGPTSHPTLLCEMDWETEGVGSVAGSLGGGGGGAHNHQGHHGSPPMGPAFPGAGFGPGTPTISSAGPSVNGSPHSGRGTIGPAPATPAPDQKLAEVPPWPLLSVLP